jgi:hypothetical protein
LSFCAKQQKNHSRVLPIKISPNQFNLAENMAAALFEKTASLKEGDQEPILPFLNLQLQHQPCSRL